MVVTPAIVSQVKDPVFQRAYAEWRENPMTLRVLSILQEASDSERLDGGVGLRAETALRYSGAVDEARDFLSLLRDMVNRVSSVSGAAGAVPLPEASYGARRPEAKEIKV